MFSPTCMYNCKFANSYGHRVAMKIEPDEGENVSNFNLQFKEEPISNCKLLCHFTDYGSLALKLENFIYSQHHSSKNSYKFSLV
jgi:hypothetical protein